MVDGFIFSSSHVCMFDYKSSLSNQLLLQICNYEVGGGWKFFKLAMTSFCRLGHQ